MQNASLRGAGDVVNIGERRPLTRQCLSNKQRLEADNVLTICIVWNYAFICVVFPK